MTSAAVATGSPLLSLEVWEEDREEEGVLPTIWIQGNSVRLPRRKNTERKMAEMCALDDNSDTFPLVKVKFQSDSKQECEEYDFTTTVESAGEDCSKETRKRKQTKKVWGDDFVTDGIRRRKGPNEEEDYNLPPELPMQSGDEQEGNMSKEQDGSQVKKPTEKRKLPSPPIKIHNGKQDKSGMKEDKSGKKENQSSWKKNPNGRVENRGQAKTGVNKTARQLIQEFEERRSRDKHKQIISESDSPSSSDDDEEVRRRHKKARHSEKRERSRSRKRSPSKKKDLFPMDEGRFQRKVLYLLTEIRDSVKSAGNVEQCRGLQIQQLSTLDELKEFEQFLEEGDNLEKLKFTFNRIGGNSAAEHIKRIMEKTMTNGLQSLMNRTGKNKKFPFESTYIYSTLKDVVLEQWREKITLSKLEDKVQAVLKFAPYRIGGGKLSKESRKRAEKQNETNSHLQENDSDQAHLQKSDSDQ